MEELYKKYLSCGGVVTTDSRAIKGGEMFFALKGENFDGNAYALKALESGASFAVVNDGSEAASSGDPRVIVVPDTLVALQGLARWHREHMMVDGKRLTVVGLTGTNGKTTTKELIRSVLSKKYVVTATEGNLNNDIGVPLSLLKIRPETQIAVIEMGANHPDDIAHLVAVSEPDFGLITNVGKAHLLGFGSFDGVKKAKGQLYDYIKAHGKAVFLNMDDPDLTGMAKERGLETIGYGPDFWRTIVLPSDSAHPFLRMAIPDKPGSASEDENLMAVETRLVGSYNAVNVLAAVAVGLHFGVSLDDALQAVASYEPSNNRSQMLLTAKNSVIVDAYNANPTSMAAALDNFANVSEGKKLALLGSMGELGADSVDEHRAIVRRLGGISSVCLVGEEFRKALELEGTPENVKWFESSAALAEELKALKVSGYTILVKGSRSQQMEKVIPEL